MTRAEFVGSGPQYPGETEAQAMNENALHHLADHLLRRSRSAGDVPGSPDEGARKGTPVPIHTVTASAIRGALRPGAIPATPGVRRA